MLEAAEIDRGHQHELAPGGLRLKEGDKRELGDVVFHRDRARERGARHFDRRDVERKRRRFHRARMQRMAVPIIAQHGGELCRLRLGAGAIRERGGHG